MKNRAIGITCPVTALLINYEAAAAALSHLTSLNQPQVKKNINSDWANDEIKSWLTEYHARFWHKSGRGSRRAAAADWLADKVAPPGFVILTKYSTSSSHASDNHLWSADKLRRRVMSNTFKEEETEMFQADLVGVGRSRPLCSISSRHVSGVRCQLSHRRLNRRKQPAD